MAAHLTLLDLAVAAICLAFLARGLFTGLVRQLAFIAALILGYLAAGRFYGELAPLFSSFVSDPRLGFPLAYLVVLGLVYLAVMLVGSGLRKVMQITFLGWFDRLLGGVFGLGKAVFLSTLLFMLLSWLLADASPVMRTSFVSPYLATSARFLLGFVSDAGLRDSLLPKNPAIGPDLLPPAKPPVKKGKPAGGDAAPETEQDKLIDEAGAKRAI